jgi:polysaccharide deacetylase 2 family uncharacterized protein YibQ
LTGGRRKAASRSARSPATGRRGARKVPRRPLLIGLGAAALLGAGLAAGLWLGGGGGDAPPARTAGVTVPVARPAAPTPAPDAARPRPPHGEAGEAERLAAARPPAPPPSVREPGTEAPAWIRHAVPAAPPPGAALVAVIIDDMGVDRARSARAAALPGPLTLAFLPYARDVGAQAAAARAKGHELMVHVPMEPTAEGVDPGPDALLTGLDGAENLRRLRAALGAFDGYVGLNNHMGSRFTAERRGLEPVLAEAARAGLLFVDSRTTPASVALDVAREKRMPSARRDVFLDHEATPEAVRAALRRLEETARRQGHAIAIGHPHDATVEALAEWLPTLAARGFALVPVSHVVRLQAQGG